MLHSRYAYARSFCEGKDVLEVACGAGQGLGYLAKRARRLVGADCTPALLTMAQRHYQQRVPLVCLDAHHLPFPDASFDVVLLFEAIYYLADADRFIHDCRRVLRQNGLLLVCSANKSWPGFSPSPYSIRYFDAQELRRALTGAGFETEVYGVFPAVASTAAAKLVAFVRRVAAKLNLIPDTLKGRELLKRLFYGRLAAIDPEIDEPMTQPAQLFPLRHEQASSDYRVLYAVARASSG